MRVVETKVYPFAELAEVAQKAALNMQFNINVDHDWWDLYYESAMETEHFKITGFDTDRGAYVHGDFNSSALDTALAIQTNHGTECDSHKLAVKFILEFDNDKTLEENEFCEEGLKQALLETHLVGLRAELEYKYSDEAIKETIESGELEFLECGKLFNL